MGIFSGLSKRSDCREYENVGFATTTTTCEGEPPLVTAIATPVTAATAASSSMPTVAEAINTSKLTASTVAVGTTSALSNASCPPMPQPSGGSELPITSGRFPTSITACPSCHSSEITTKIRTYPSFVTWAVIIFLFLVFWPVCWFPLVIDSCKTTDHYCTHCNENVGSVKPLSDCCVKEMG
mmetsp:Transcript_26463/g.41525  ORF Transcript_26463/g.41525 Transcript_26463/m.41525 type:complete len:182 (+) Transcript_26463:138-683(+)